MTAYLQHLVIQSDRVRWDDSHPGIGSPPSMSGPMTHAPKLADRIWNRACAGGEQATKGDSALAALLAFHSPAMNGGVLHALECLNQQAVSAAIAGYIFYGFPAVASLLERGARRVEEAVDLEFLEAELDEEYGVHIPDDSVIVQAFEDHLRRSPADFAPLE